MSSETSQERSVLLVSTMDVKKLSTTSRVGDSGVGVHDELLADFLLHRFLLLVLSAFLTSSSSVLLSLLVVFLSLLFVELGLSKGLFASLHGIFVVFGSLLDTDIEHESSDRFNTDGIAHVSINALVEPWDNVTTDLTLEGLLHKRQVSHVAENSLAHASHAIFSHYAADVFLMSSLALSFSSFLLDGSSLSFLFDSQFSSFESLSLDQLSVTDLLVLLLLGLDDA